MTTTTNATLVRLEAIRRAGEERGRARGLTRAQRVAVEAAVRMHVDDRRDQRRLA